MDLRHHGIRLDPEGLVLDRRRDSGIIDAYSLTKQIDVDVSGRQELQLISTDDADGINADWAIWADARLLR